MVDSLLKPAGEAFEDVFKKLDNMVASNPDEPGPFVVVVQCVSYLGENEVGSKTKQQRFLFVSHVHLIPFAALFL